LESGTFLSGYFLMRGEREIVPTKKIKQIVGLNLGIALVDTVLFSPGLIGIQIEGTSILATAFGVTIIFMSIVLFAYGNYKLLTEKEKIIQTSKITTTEDYIKALKENCDKKTFQKDINLILEQIERLQKKKETIIDILLQKFSNTEMSYKKFEGAVLAVENVFYMNIKSVLNKLNAFDEEDYDRVKKDAVYSTVDKELIDSKMNIYNEYITFVNNATEDNEQIILKLDKLLFEISKFNSLETGEIDNMGAMKEIDELTTQTKYYK
jgi:hypothetical protein